MYGLEALIFDVDGTLADTERDGHRCAFNAAFAEVGLDWSWSVDLYGDLLAVTGGKERIRYFIERWRPAFADRDHLDEFIADLHRRKTRHYLQILSRGQLPLRAGVMRLLSQARDAGVRLAIATTTTPENVTTLLEHSGGADVPHWFEVIAAGDVVPSKKPAADIFRLTLEALGLPARACVAVEDSVNGVRAALEAGLRAILVTVNPYTQHQDFCGAALVTDGLGEPGCPVKVLRGSLVGSDHIDLAALEAMHKCVYVRHEI
jgi:HAD superfamily hydrolase (TIGR01509 family)